MSSTTTTDTRAVRIVYRNFSFHLFNINPETTTIKNLVELAEQELLKQSNPQEIPVRLQDYKLEATMFAKVPDQNFMPASRLLINDAPLMYFIDPTDEWVEVKFTKLEDKGEKRAVEEDKSPRKRGRTLSF